MKILIAGHEIEVVDILSESDEAVAARAELSNYFLTNENVLDVAQIAGMLTKLSSITAFGTAASANTSQFATSAQGAKIDAITMATELTGGLVKKAPALVNPPANLLTNNTGGTSIVGGVLGLLAGLVYATDAALLKNILATLITGQNTTRARLEELYTKLKDAGHIS